MAAPNEGTTNLPYDTVGDKHVGVWDAGSGVYRAFRGDTNGMQVKLWSAANTPLLTTTNPGYIAATDGAIASLGAITDAEASGSANGNTIQLLKRLRTLLGGTLAVSVAGGQSPIGSISDVEVSGAGDASAIAILKRIRTLLSGAISVTVSALSLTGGGIYVAATTAYVAAGTASGVIAGLGATSNLRFVGYAARETAGSATVARFAIRKTNVSGAPLAVCGLVANESREEWYGPEGKDAATGMYLHNLAGTFELSVFYKVVA